MNREDVQDEAEKQRVAKRAASCTACNGVKETITRRVSVGQVNANEAVAGAWHVRPLCQQLVAAEALDVCFWCVSFPSSLCSFCCIVLFGISFRTSKVFAEGLVVLFLSPCYYKLEVGIKPNCVAQCDSWQQPDFSVYSSVTLLL